MALVKKTFLIDYELLDHTVNGLDLIEKLGIEERSVLVTSRYEESNVKLRCETFGVKLLPKALAGFVPINIELEKRLVDWILIDDDDLVHMTWKLVATEKQKSFVGFKSYEEFEAMEQLFNVKSKLFIDSKLGNGIMGEQVAKQISTRGFLEIYLCTGYEASSFPEMPWLKKAYCLKTHQSSFKFHISS